MLRFWTERLTKSCPHRRALELSTTLGCGYARSAAGDVLIESNDVVLVVIYYCTVGYLARFLEALRQNIHPLKRTFSFPSVSSSGSHSTVSGDLAFSAAKESCSNTISAEIVSRGKDEALADLPSQFLKHSISHFSGLSFLSLYPSNIKDEPDLLIRSSYSPREEYFAWLSLPLHRHHIRALFFLLGSM